MDLRTLRCFLTVAEEGSITRAALRLHMSQPPLSVRLQALERELDVALLVRNGRGVELTAAGRVLADRARRLLSDADSTAEAVRSVGQGMRGHLSVTVGATVAPSLLAGLLASMRASAPSLKWWPHFWQRLWFRSSCLLNSISPQLGHCVQRCVGNSWVFRPNGLRSLTPEHPPRCTSTARRCRDRYACQ